MLKKVLSSILLLITFIFNSGFIVVGHRGDPIKAPEESFQSLDLAFNEGAQYVEVDLHESSDNQLIISHDRNLLRTTGNNIIVSEHPANQLTQLKQRNGQPVYTLDQLFARYQNRPNTKFLIETKKTKHGNPQNMEELLVNAIKKYHFENRVMVHSFSLASLQNLQKLMPQIPRIFIAGSLSKINFETLQYSNAINVSSNLLTSQLVDQLHAINQRVYVWDEMNEDPKQWNWLVNLPIDGIVTNFPATASHYQKLKRQANQSNADFDAVFLNKTAVPIWENPYPKAPQKGTLASKTPVHIQKVVTLNQQEYYQIADNRFIADAGFVQTDLIPSLTPFFNQLVRVRSGQVDRNLNQAPHSQSPVNGSLLPQACYQVTALQNIDGTNWAQINYHGWLPLNNLLVVPTPDNLPPNAIVPLAHQGDISIQNHLALQFQPPCQNAVISPLPALKYIVPSVADFTVLQQWPLANADMPSQFLLNAK